MDHPEPWLLAVAAAHLGFQATVDLVVYPALAEVAPGDWEHAHARHSRRIVPLVAVLYPSLLGLLGWAVLTRPDAAGSWLALLGGVLAMATTAGFAAPAHGRLASAPATERVALLRGLVLADRVRTAGAAICLVGALLLVQW